MRLARAAPRKRLRQAQLAPFRLVESRACGLKSRTPRAENAQDTRAKPNRVSGRCTPTSVRRYRRPPPAPKPAPPPAAAPPLPAPPLPNAPPVAPTPAPPAAVPVVLPVPVLLVVPADVPLLVALGTPPVVLGTPLVALGIWPGRTEGTVGAVALLFLPPADEVEADPPVPGVLKPAAAPPLELTGGVITTVEPGVPVVPDVPPVLPVTVVVPAVPLFPAFSRAAGTLPAPPAPPGKRQVTSRFEQKSGIVVRSVDASAAWALGNDIPTTAAAKATTINFSRFNKSPCIQGRGASIARHRMPDARSALTLFLLQVAGHPTSP